MDTSAYRNTATITIERPAEELYDLVADVSQMGRWSPVCTGGTYDDDGEWFTGTNAATLRSISAEPSKMSPYSSRSVS